LLQPFNIILKELKFVVPHEVGNRLLFNKEDENCKNLLVTFIAIYSKLKVEIKKN